MTMKALFVPLLIQQVVCMRLDLEDVRSKVAPESSNGERLPISLVVAVGREKCTNFIDSKLDRDAHFVAKGDLLSNENGDILSSTTKGYYAYFEPFRTYLTQNTHHVRETFNYVAWSKDDTSYKFYLQQLTDDTTRYASHWRNLPANRMYALVVGQVERANDDDTDHFTEAKEACEDNVRVEMQLLIDQWATGDDLTEWPSESNSLTMAQHEVIYNQDSTVYARIGDIKLDGQVGSLLGKSSAQKAYWILDITHVDRLDLTVSGAKFKNTALGVRDGNGFARGTWWWAFEGDHHKDVDVQSEWISNSRSSQFLCLVTDIGAAKSKISTDRGNNVDVTKGEATMDACLGYNGASCQTDISECGTQNLFGQEWTWSDKTHKASRVMPVVACGLFNKVWKSKSCIRNIKSEKEG